MNSKQSFAHDSGTIHLARRGFAITTYKEENDSTANPKRSIEVGVGTWRSTNRPRVNKGGETTRGLQGVSGPFHEPALGVLRDREKGEIIRHSSKWESLLPEDVEDQYPVSCSKQKPIPIRLQSVGQFNLVPRCRDVETSARVRHKGGYKIYPRGERTSSLMSRRDVKITSRW